MKSSRIVVDFLLFFQKLTSKALHFGHGNSRRPIFKAILLFAFLHDLQKLLSKYKNAFLSSKWKTRNIFSMKASSRFSLTLCKLKNVLMWTHFLAPVENWLPSWVNASQCNSKAAFFVIHEQSSRYCLYISLVMAQLPSCFSWKSCYFYSSSPFLPPPLTLLCFLFSLLIYPRSEQSCIFEMFIKISSKAPHFHIISFPLLGGSLKNPLKPSLGKQNWPTFRSSWLAATQLIWNQVSAHIALGSK